MSKEVFVFASKSRRPVLWGGVMKIGDLVVGVYSNGLPIAKLPGPTIGVDRVLYPLRAGGVILKFVYHLVEKTFLSAEAVKVVSANLARENIREGSRIVVVVEPYEGDLQGILQEVSALIKDHSEERPDETTSE